jgi:hypothetical protein
VISKVFVVYDSKAEAYLNPFIVRTRGEALRMWVDIVNDDQGPFKKHPGDYTLFEIAEYDSSTAQYRNLEAKSSLGLALDFLKPPSITPGPARRELE